MDSLCLDVFLVGEDVSIEDVLLIGNFGRAVGRCFWLLDWVETHV